MTSSLAIHLLGIGALGALAGAVTTLSGLGGGLLLVTALTALWGPHLALPVSALALLVGNLHRLSLYRGHLRADLVRPLLVGLVPGSAVGAVLVSGIPAGVLRGAMVGLVAMSLARARAGATWRFPAAALAPVGGAVGVLAGAAGGAAVLTGPLVMSTGVHGDEYLATMSMTAVAMHLSRTAGYGAGGLIGATTIGWAALLAGALMLGNLLGRVVRRQVGQRTQTALEYGAMIAAAGLALVGIG